MRSLIKVYLDRLEERASVKLQSTDVILLWLIIWVAMAYSRYKLGEDGKTPYERQKGRKCVLEVVQFGELVRCKKAGRDIARAEISGEFVVRRRVVGARKRFE